MPKKPYATPKTTSFSGVFQLTPGIPLALKRDIADQLPGIIGKSFREIRADMGITGSNPNAGSNGDLNIQDGIAIISMMGPITRYDTACSALFGGVSIESMRNQLYAALDSADVQGILFNIDSPGGVTDGVADFADEIAQGSEAFGKPVYGFVDSMGASAAYWLGSAADKLIVSQTGFVGSIGVYAAYQTGPDDGSIYIIASQSPKKIPDVTEVDGRIQIQSHIDELADVFISSVAQNRNTSIDNVLSNFGQGDIVIGADAVQRGMADMVGDFSTAFHLLQSDINAMQTQQQTGRYALMTVDELMAANPDTANELLARGAVNERERILGIDSLDTETNRAVAGDLIDKAKVDPTKTKADLAVAILDRQKEKLATIAESRKADAQEIPAVASIPSPSDDATEIEALATGIAKAQAKINGGRN